MLAQHIEGMNKNSLKKLIKILELRKDICNTTMLKADLRDPRVKDLCHGRNIWAVLRSPAQIHSALKRSRLRDRMVFGSHQDMHADAFDKLPFA